METTDTQVKEKPGEEERSPSRQYRLDELNALPGNYRIHALPRIKALLRRFGFMRSIAVWIDGIIAAGNGTTKALQEMMADGEDPPVNIGVAEDGMWLVTGMDCSHWPTLAEAKAAAAGENQSHQAGEDDPQLLADLLQEVQEVDEELLEVTGFDAGYIDDLLAELGEAAGNPDADAEPKIDRAEELREEWGTEPGQLWKLGTHRLSCNDCTNRRAVAHLMGEERADLVWTDPPYGVAIGDKNKLLNSMGKSNRVERNLENDTLDEAGLIEMLRASFGAAASICTKGASWYVAAPPGPLHLLFGQALNELGIWRQTIQWVKNNATFSPLGVSYHWQSEPIFYGWLPNGPHRFFGDRTQTTVWEIDRPAASPEHPTMKPVELVTRAIEHTTRPGQITFEPFAGSGTTIIAAEQLGRRCYAMEIDPGYVAVCLQRYLDATGEQPVLLDEQA